MTDFFNLGFNLGDRVAVVVGASSGLGADAARAYAAAGADVALLARRVDRLEALGEEIESAGGRTAVSAVLDACERIDILLNNAGVAVRGGVETLNDEEWDRSFDTNVKGIVHVSKYVVPHMKERSYGKIVNIASVNAVIADKQDVFVRHAYNASKAAVLGLTRGMACSYARYGITVNAVGPGLFASEMTESTLFKSDEFLDAYGALNPTGRPGRRGELNGTILYLSSDASSYVQGQFVVVDGGMTIV